MKKIIFLVSAMFVAVFMSFQFLALQVHAQEVQEKIYPLYISVAGEYAGETFLIKKAFYQHERETALMFMQVEVDAALERILHNHPNALRDKERITLAFVGEYRGQLIVLQYMPAEFDVARRIFLGDIENEFEKIDRAISCR